MKRLYEWITKANQVLLFPLIILVGIGVSFLFYDLYLSRRPYQPPSVAVAQSTEEAKKSVIEDVRFLDEYDGIYVFGLMKRIIVADESALRKAGSLGSDDGRDNTRIVNVVFSKLDQPVKKLLQNDGLILSNDIYNESEPQKLRASAFVCVTEDTDGNHRLDENDRNDLYVVSPNFDKPYLVVKGISMHQLMSPTRLAVKTRENDVIHFWDIDIETQAKKEIPWK